MGPRCDCDRHARAGAVARPGPPGLVPALLAVLAVVVAGVAAGPPAPAAAAWGSSTTTATATLSVAKVESLMQKLTSFGTLSPSGYAVGTLLFGTGYVDLTNSSTVPAAMTTTMTMPVLVSGVRVDQCSVPWNTGNGSCAGTSTLLASSALLGTPTHTRTWPAVPAGGKIHLKASVGGLLGGVGLTWDRPVPRAAMDRTAG